MKTVPVLATIRDAYRFTLGHLGAIIGLIWLPMILLTVIGFFVKQRFYAAAADALASGNQAGLGPTALGFLCYVIAGLLLVTMMSVPVTQLALGARKEGAMMHFAFGGMEWRLFRGMMSLLGFLLLPLLLLAALGTLLQSGLVPMGGARGASAVQFLAMLFYFAGIYFLLRFGVLLPALATSESGPMLTRAWQLSAGNAWRILLVMVAAVLPIWLLSAVILWVAQGGQGQIPQMDSTAALVEYQFHEAARQMPLSSGIDFLLAPLLLGLVLSAGAGIYRALTGPGEFNAD